MRLIAQHRQITGYEFEQAHGEKDREDWHVAVHGVSKSQPQLCECTTTT